jgi:hypothetical protein
MLKILQCSMHASDKNIEVIQRAMQCDFDNISKECKLNNMAMNPKNTISVSYYNLYGNWVRKEIKIQTFIRYKYRKYRPMPK